jgi:long-chain acyl-CoA synthetase
MTQRKNMLDFFRDYFVGNREYLLYDDGYRRWTYSYRQIRDAAQLAAVRLREQGVRDKDYVLLWSESRPEWLFAFWGTLLAGAVAVPVGSEFSFDFVQRVGAVAPPKVVALGEDVRWSDDSSASIWRLTGENWAQPPSEVPSLDIHRGDLAEIVFTSGSTGDPKGVEITHGNLLSQVEAIEPVCELYRKLAGPLLAPRLLQLLPLSHLFGQVTTVGLPPLIRGSTVITRRRGPGALAQLIREQKISAAFCVPRWLDALRRYVIAQLPETVLAESDDSPVWLKLWRYRRGRRMFGWRFLGFLPGGAPLDPTLEDFWRNLGFLVIQGYGLTETSPVVTMNGPLHSRRRSVGRPLPEVVVSIADDGEILVRGPNVTRGYYADPESSAEVLRNGWLHTGDLGCIDADGYLYVHGRKKDVIITAEGWNVIPEDVERILAEVPGVCESAVVGIRGDRGEHLHAVVVLDPGANKFQILDEANRRLEPHQRIRSISEWTEGKLPRTAHSGKLRRSEIRNSVAACFSGRPGNAPSLRTARGNSQTIWSSVERELDRPLTPETRLDELGLSSIDRVELLIEAEQLGGCEINEAEFTARQTVGEVNELLAQSLANPERARTSMEPARSGFPRWSRRWPARALRWINLAFWILPVTRLLTRPVRSGVEKIGTLTPPVIFVANHQSHLDTPLILAALPQRWRYRVAPAMYKEYFSPHFHPREFTRRERVASSLKYYAVVLAFHAFPIPQQEAGLLDALRYAGDLVSDGWSLLIYPEGERRPGGQMGEFHPGVGLFAARLKVPLVPLRLEGVDRVLPPNRMLPRFHRTRIAFGDPIRAQGEDPLALARRLKESILAL